MKFSILFLLVNLAVWTNTGCKKERVDEPVSVPNTPANPTVENTAPVAYAGKDNLIWTPHNYVTLKGNASDIENNVSRVSWAKISGPASFSIENPVAYDTKVNDLEIGVYEFELTVTDNKNLFDKDTVVVTVKEWSNPGEIIFSDLTWIFPWYNNIEIPDFVNLMPPGTPFKVFIQRDNDPAWKEVPTEFENRALGDPYDYIIIFQPHNFYSDGSLYINYYGLDVDDSPNVRIGF